MFKEYRPCRDIIQYVRMFREKRIALIFKCLYAPAWSIRKPFGRPYGSIKCDTLFHLQIQPAIIQAVGNCHCLNGDFQFRALTRNPVNAAYAV